MNTVENIIPLSDFIKKKLNSNDKLPFETTQVFYEKNAILISPGMIEKNLYFICSGIIQISLITKKGAEKIIVFHFANDTFNSLSSFISQKPTAFTITCLTDCVFEVIKREDIYDNLETSPVVIKLYKYQMESAYMKRINKEIGIMAKEAEERYKDLLKEQPELLKLLKISQIAKYLGIHPFSLSRIRNSKY